MRTFIRAAEVWVPTPGRDALFLHDGTYGSLEGFREASQSVTFERGEGLPGLAWQTGRPVVLAELEDSIFVRTELARSAGLTSAVALPIFAGEFLMAVLVLLCGDSEDLIGAIEVWREDDQKQLALADGYFGDLGHFARMSELLKFRRGIGLPGLVWERGAPVVMSDFSRSSSFLRAKSASDVGIEAALGLPFYTSGRGLDSVVTFLSSSSTPIARRFEIWRPDREANRLRCTTSLDGSTKVVTDAPSIPTLEPGQGTIGGVWTSGVPGVSSDVKAEPNVTSNPEAYADLTSMLVIPILEDGRLLSVVVCYN